MGGKEVREKPVGFGKRVVNMSTSAHPRPIFREEEEKE